MIFDKKFIKEASEQTDEALALKYQAGDNSAINSLLGRHKDLIKFKVNNYKSMPVPAPAVYGEGMKILAVAAKRYSPSADVKFRTFLESNLRGLNRYTHTNKNVLHFPQNKMLKIKAYQEVRDLLTQQYGRSPSDWQMADSLGWSIPEVREFSRKIGQRELAASGMEDVVGNQQRDDATRSSQIERSEFLYYSLTPPEQKVYDYALGRHGKRKLKTDSEISLMTGLSPSKVNRVRKDLAHRVQND